MARAARPGFEQGVLMDYETFLDVGAAPRPYFRNRPGTRASRSERIQMGATRLGISVEEYERHVEAGQRWCSAHQRWCPAEAFGRNKRVMQDRPRRVHASALCCEAALGGIVRAY